MQLNINIEKKKNHLLIIGIYEHLRNFEDIFIELYSTQQICGYHSSHVENT